MNKIFERESSGQLKNGNRRYIKRGTSPEQTRSGSSNFQSNKESFQKLAAQVYQPSSCYGQSQNRIASNKNSKAGLTSKSHNYNSKEESLINIQLLGLSNSKNFMGDRRKKGKSSFYKKVPEVSNYSDLFFSNNNYNPQKPAVRQQTNNSQHITNNNKNNENNNNNNMNKISSQSEASLDENSLNNPQAEHQVEQLHYRMVEFQHKCKKMVNN